MSPLIIDTVAPDEVPLALLLEADPSETAIARYRAQSHCLLAREGDTAVGACLLLPREGSWLELVNIAVAPGCQGRGIGHQLLAEAIAFARQQGAQHIGLGTGTFGYQLAFYQRAGFRVMAVERDHFLIHYPEPIVEGGIQHQDRLWLEYRFTQ